MESLLCKLTLVYPTDANDRIVEILLNLDPPISGFTTWAGEGHGFGFSKASVSERVRGRVKRTILVAVLPRVAVPRLLAVVADKAPIPHLTHWIEPVESFSQLQRQPSIQLAPDTSPANTAS